MLTMSIPVLTGGGQDYSDCQILAGGIVATVLIHVVLCIVSYYPRRGILNFHRYRKENWRLITQRISGIVILILLVWLLGLLLDWKWTYARPGSWGGNFWLDILGPNGLRFWLGVIVVLAIFLSGYLFFKT